jgi:hypothetical protein
MSTWASSVFDRAVRTGLQTLLAYLSAAKLINEVAWVPALSATFFAVVLSLLTSVVASPSWGDALGFQVAERAVKTFLQSVIAFVGAATMFDQVDWKTALSSAGLAAVYSVVTSVLTTKMGPVGQVDVSSPPTGAAPSAHLQGA